MRAAAYGAGADRGEWPRKLSWRVIRRAWQPQLILRLPPRGVVFAIVGIAAVVAMTVVAARYGQASEKGAPRWDWSVGSAVATAGGTTLLAIGTFLLAYGTRRPKLTLEAGQAFATHSHVESDTRPHLRLLVRNRRGCRSAVGTRVLVDGYRRADEQELRRLGSPSLGWPSAPEAADAAVVIFGGSGRPVALGELWRIRALPDGKKELVSQLLPDGRTFTVPAHRADDPQSTWYLKLGLHGLIIGDFREFLSPGEWVVRVVVGADEADGRAHEINVKWEGDAKDAQAAFESVTVNVRPL